MTTLLGTDNDALNAGVGRSFGSSLLQEDAQPRFFEGNLGGALGTGVYRGLSRGAAALANTATPALTPIAKRLDEAFGTSVEGFLLDEQDKANRALVESKLDGNTTGIAGQVLYGVGDVLTTVAATGGNAPLAGGLYGSTQAMVGMSEGLDANTALAKGAIEGVGMAVGVALPASLTGGLAYRVATGAGLNVAQGAGTRAGVSTLLESRGYADMAKQYQAFGVEDVLVDAVLGAAFGGALGKRVDPSQVDAALVKQAQIHQELGTAPGAPVDVVSRQAHNAAVEKAIEQVRRGEEVEVSQIAERATFLREEPPRDVVDAVESLKQSEELRQAARDLEDLNEQARSRGLMGEAALYSRRAEVEQSPEFKAWFGESKVVDSDGRPLVVYHGTAKAGYNDVTDISAFDKSKVGGRFSADEKGFFFTSFKPFANDYANGDADYRNPGEGGGAVYPVYVSLKKPLIIDGEFLRKEGMEPIGYSEDTITFWDNYQSLILDWAKRSNADGVILRDSVEFVDGSPVQTIVAFKPEQIKSATGNRGTFDPNNPDITFSRGPGESSTVADLTAAFKAEFGKDAQRLMDFHRVEFVDTVADLPGGPHPEDVRGMYLNGRSYVVAKNTPVDALKGLILHEIGTHAGMKTMLGDALYKSVLDQVEAKIAAGDETFKLAREIATERANRPEHIHEETLAYLVEAAPELPLVRRILAAVRQWLYRVTGGRYVTLNADDMTAMASAALRVYARQAEAQGRAGGAMYESADPTRAADIQRIQEAGIELKTPVEDNPTMEIPDESGAVRPAAEVAAETNAEAQRMSELAQGFEVAVACAFRFGT